MQLENSAYLVLTVLLGIVLGWGMARLQLRGRLAAQKKQLAQLEAARHLADQQNAQARRQIEQLQRLMQEQHPTHRHHPRPEQTVAATPAEVSRLLADDEPDKPADGFAPTQLLHRP